MHEKRRERGRTYRVGLILGFCLLIAVNGLFPVSCVYAEEEQTKIAYGENTPGQLYARSAVLMDADSGRILFAKNCRNRASYGEYNQDHDLHSCIGTCRPG